MRKQLKDFIEAIGRDAVAIIPAAHEVTRSYDTEFKFHQDPDFFYLTGFPEHDAVAVIDPSSKKNKFTLFVRPRDPLMETWYGRREGVDGAKKNYGVDKALPIEKLESELPKLLNGKDKIVFAAKHCRRQRYDDFGAFRVAFIEAKASQDPIIQSDGKERPAPVKVWRMLDKEMERAASGFPGRFALEANRRGILVVFEFQVGRNSQVVLEADRILSGSGVRGLDE